MFNSFDSVEYEVMLNKVETTFNFGIEVEFDFNASVEEPLERTA